MKKMTVLLLALAMVLCLSACGCKHVWSEATCTAPKTCAECGETEGEALGHSWSEATCQKAKTCDNCSATEGEALEHQIKWKLCEGTTDSMEGTCAVCSEQLTAETDWALVADSRIIGNWRSAMMTNTESFKMMKYYDDFAEFREDGTGTIVLMGTAFEFTWAFKEFDDTYFHVTRYTLHVDGEDLTAVFTGADAVNLTLYYDPIRLDFVSVDYGYEDMAS